MLLFLVTSLALSVSGLVVYTRFVLDPTSYVAELPFKMLLGVYEEMAKKTHRGAEPCLRYPGSDPVADGELAGLAEEIVRGGHADNLHLLMGEFRAWDEELERQHHDAPRVDEILEALWERMGPWDRLIYTLAQDRIHKAATDASAAAEDKVHNLSAQTLVLNAPEYRAQVRTLWERCPRCLALPSMVRLLDQVRIKLTAQRLNRLAAQLVDWAKQEGDFPEDLRALIPAVATSESLQNLKDGWHQEFVYTRIAGGVRLTSLGKDFASGGEGAEADQEVEIAHPSATSLASEEDRCAAPENQVEIRRAEAAAILSNDNGGIHVSRVVPAFENGQPIGFKIYTVWRDSLTYRLGLRDGDIVLSLMGERLDSPEKALQLYQRAKTVDRLDVEIRRCGNPYLIEVLLR